MNIHMGDDTMEHDDLIERCAYCDNNADDYCERCGTSLCDMHTIYDACPACAIVAHIKRIDNAMHVLQFGDLPMNTRTHMGDDLIERCDFCDNVAVTQCPLCDATVCNYHITH